MSQCDRQKQITCISFVFLQPIRKAGKKQNFIFFFYFSQLERLGKNKILSKYEIRNTLLKIMR